MMITATLLASTCYYDGKTPHTFGHDVVIYGGTPAGIAAAIQAARDGKSVALIEPSSRLGGIMVNGLGGTDIDNHKGFQNSHAVGGIALEFYRRVANYYGYGDAFADMLKHHTKDPWLWRFEPHVAEEILSDWVLEHAPISVFLNNRLAEEEDAVTREGTRIRKIRTENGAAYRGTVFIDATLEGDLLAAAGVSTTWGRESNSLYGETKNGIRAETTHAQFTVSVDPYVRPGDPSSGVIPTVQDEPLGIPGEADKSIQAYCFRMCLTQDEDNRIPFQKPRDYDRTQYEIYLRYLKAGGKLYTPHKSIPNGKTDLGAWHDLSHNLYGMNHDYASGSYSVRQKIFNEHKSFTQGLFYFLANDGHVGTLDSSLQNTWKRWGLCKDEFTDNGGWPRQFYVRDARRMLSDYVMTEHHTRRVKPAVVDDPVAVAYWPPDLHSVRRIVRDGHAYNEGFVFGGDSWRPFGIAYRSLVPKKNECTNLLTPTCPSSSHVAYGALRIEFTYMAMGQACGIAAALALDRSADVQDIDYPSLRDRLVATGQVIDAANLAMPD